MTATEQRLAHAINELLEYTLSLAAADKRAPDVLLAFQQEFVKLREADGDQAAEDLWYDFVRMDARQIDGLLTYMKLGAGLIKWANQMNENNLTSLATTKLPNDLSKKALDALCGYAKARSATMTEHQLKGLATWARDMEVKAIAEPLHAEEFFAKAMKGFDAKQICGLCGYLELGALLALWGLGESKK